MEDAWKNKEKSELDLIKPITYKALLRESNQAHKAYFKP